MNICIYVNRLPMSMASEMMIISEPRVNKEMNFCG